MRVFEYPVIRFIRGLSGQRKNPLTAEVPRDESEGRTRK